MGMFPMLGRLNLTDAQREQVKSLLDSHRDETRALADKSGTAHRAWRLPYRPSSSTSQPSARAARMSPPSTPTWQSCRRASTARSGEILTPDQQKQARDLQTEMQRRRQDGGRTAPK
jgi:Spy/CpxP family protein refolding chaperone